MESNKQLLESFLVGNDSDVNLLASPNTNNKNSNKTSNNDYADDLERKIALAMSGSFNVDDFDNTFNNNNTNSNTNNAINNNTNNSNTSNTNNNNSNTSNNKDERTNKSKFELSITKEKSLSHSNSNESFNKKVTINAPPPFKVSTNTDPLSTVAKKGTYTPQPRRVQVTSSSSSPTNQSVVSPLNTPGGFRSVAGSELSELTINDGWSLKKRFSESHEKPIVKVAIRVRPFTVAEVQSGARRIISFNGNKLVIVNPNAFDADPDTIAAVAAAVHCKEWAQVFRFNHCLWSYDPDDAEDEYVNQEGVYRTIGSEIVENALNGISASCFSYGHTSTGKTYAMFGTIDPALLSSTNGNSSFITSASSLSENCGIIPRVFSDIIEGLKRKDDSCKDTKISMSFIEIYNEKIRDLLAPTKGSSDQELRVREHPVIGPYVEGLTKVPIESSQQALQLIYAAHSKRETASTTYNHQSSRSHAVVTLELTPLDFDSQAFRSYSPTKSRSSIGSSSKEKFKDFESNIVRVQMVDLAGSEKDNINGFKGRREDEELETLSTSKKVQGVSLGFNSRNVDPNAEKTEMKLIRQSLSTLGYIIKSLAVGTPFKSLPYRDSVLTWILRDALNGRNNTTMLATLSPSHIYYDESLSTLKYAERLCQVGHKVGFNDPFHLSRRTPTQQQKDSSTNDFAKIHEALGANKPGTPAARQLLRQTINDPQQRIAKMNTTKQLDVMPTKDFENSVIAALEAEPTNTERSTFEDLRDNYRVLYNKFIELQIELENARADRDSMLIELQSVKDSHDATNLGSSSSKTTISDLSMALKLSEKEIVELRSLIKRKEEQIERLLADISDEKRSRMGTEEAVHAQANEFIIRIEALQRENKEYAEELGKARADVAIAKQDKNSLKAEVDSLKSIYIGEIEMLKTMYQKDVEVLKKGLVNAKENFQEELRKANEVSAKLSADVNEAKTSQLAAEKIAREMIRTIERIKSEVGALTLERDSLLGIIDRQEAAMKLQHQQSEASLKMLHQRQAALERVETDAANSMDELLRLQDGLEGMLTREGTALHSELLDAKRLTAIISTIRERMNDATKLNEELIKERSMRMDLEIRKDTVESELRELRSSLPTAGVQQINDKVLELEKQLKAKEALATYWQQVAEKMNENVEEAGNLELKAKNIELQEQLAAAKAETAKTKDELKTTKENMQTEFASLWMAVQELNKLDSAKDQELKSIIEERDRALREKQMAADNLKEFQQKYSAVQAELTEVDKYLVEALGTNINRSILKTSTDRLNAQHNNNNNNNNNNNMIRTSSTPQSSRVVTRTPQTNGSKPIPQYMLENQLQQLNEFLDEDKSRLKNQKMKIKERTKISRR